VLQVAVTGGFVPPQTGAGRLPLVSVYGDGRVVAEGPVAAVHPGPALPNLQVQRIDAAGVQALVDRALAAGVGDTGDLGAPPLADAPSTRVTLSTGLETLVREAYALTEAGAEASGLTADQVAARAELRDLVDALTDLPATLGADAVSDAEPYVPEAVGAVVSPWTDPGDGLARPAQPWPGPALPGEPLEPGLGLGCVVATGEQAQSVLRAARSATAVTPWGADDGARWSLLLRPLLPSESGCADLRGR
jgi:hypothetical protein